MIVQEYKKEDVYAAASKGFASLYVILRDKVKAAWKSMPKDERDDAVCGLVKLNDVAKDPGKYLSRNSTIHDWNARAAKYAEERGVPKQAAYYIVHSPECVLVDELGGLLRTGQDFAEVYNFAQNVMRYDYELTSPAGGLSAQYAQKVVNTSRLLNARARAIKANPIARPFLEIWAGMRNFEK